MDRLDELDGFSYVRINAGTGRGFLYIISMFLYYIEIAVLSSQLELFLHDTRHYFLDKAPGQG